MAAEAKTSHPTVVHKDLATVLRQVFGPVGQVLIFIVGSAVILGLIVVVLAALVEGSRPGLRQQVITILPLVIIDGLIRGFLFATIALGYTMVYGVLEFINFAHGEIFMVGAFVGAGFGMVLSRAGMLDSFSALLFVLISVLLGATVSGLLAVGIERVAYRPLRGAPRLVPLISAIGVSLLLQDLVRLIVTNIPGLGFNARFDSPNMGAPIRLFDMPVGERLIPVTINPKALIFIIAALLMLVGLNYIVNITRLGKAIRSVAQDAPTASLMGVNVNQIIALTFLIGGSLGGAAGVLFGLTIGTVNPTWALSLGSRRSPRPCSAASAISPGPW
jgi:amino acid/amide ABC transporter membrane protein 1, HAAT family (TC 3.A.1.4.-)